MVTAEVAQLMKFKQENLVQLYGMVEADQEVCN